MSAETPFRAGAAVSLFVRPEAMLIQPDPSLGGINRFQVSVKAVLFDGANSRILAAPTDGAAELLIALPQNRQYDHIREGDVIEVGWDPKAAICFEAP